MKLNTKLTAVAAGIGIAAAAGSAQANFSLGEYWAVDQINGVAHIFSQADLNDPSITNSDQSRVNIAVQGHKDGVPSTRLHILGFSNHAGIDPASRAVFSYLDGWMEIWASNGGTGAPTPIAAIEVSTVDSYMDEFGKKGPAPDKGNTIHACSGNPQNDQIQCASIFNGDFVLFDADMSTDTYNRIGIFRTGDLKLSKDLNKNKDLKGKVQAAFDSMLALDSNPNNICSGYSTDGNLLYLAVQTGTTTGGVIVVDVSKPSSPTILDAYNDVMAAGCGLVNSPDGEHLWITHGFNKHGDPEEISIWNYALAGQANGPVDRVALPTNDDQAIYGGDAHGAQFAGLFSSYMWQVMRIDDEVHVVSNDHGGGGELVHTIDLETADRKNVQPDVIDRSAFGGHMYWTTRGPRPTSAIGNPGGDSTKYNASDRHAGVDVWKTTNWGADGYFVKSEEMSEGVGDIYLCPGVPYEQLCAMGDADAVKVTSADPHGSKTLNYLTGF